MGRVSSFAYRFVCKMDWDNNASYSIRDGAAKEEEAEQGH
jgi:hypothetical protein